MRSSRALLSMKSGLSGHEMVPKLLLPMPTLWDRLGSAFQGVWSAVVDPEARSSFEGMTKDRVINHTVLGRATNGSVLVFALFHNLYSDYLWSTYKFDGKDFVQTVGPALENFFDTTETLRNHLRANKSEKQEVDEANNESPDELQSRLTEQVTLSQIEHPEDLAEALLGANRWREEATKDPDSSSADLLKMTTPQCFDSLYYVTKFGQLGMLLDPERKVYKENSCEVGGVALLDARALVMDQNENIEETEEYPEFKASEKARKDLPVAAQLDVLCEVSYTFTTANDMDKEETYNDLTVAVIEGWLNGGPDNELRWRVAQLRTPHEFEYAPSINTR